MPRFVCKDSYRQFYGYVFVGGKPTTVSDKHTLDRIRLDPSFTEVKESNNAMRSQAQKEVKRKTIHLPKRQP